MVGAERLVRPWDLANGEPGPGYAAVRLRRGACVAAPVVQIRPVIGWIIRGRTGVSGRNLELLGAENDTSTS